MPTYNMMADYVTGEVKVIGKNGRVYTLAEVEAAERAARRGDADAAATLAAVDLARDEHGRPRKLGREESHQLMEQAMDDCPLCQAERERTGKPPEVLAAGYVEEDGTVVDALETWWRRSKLRT